jgi:hypothetical protein
MLEFKGLTTSQAQAEAMKQATANNGAAAKVIVRAADKTNETPVISKMGLLEVPTIFGDFNNWRGQKM